MSLDRIIVALDFPQEQEALRIVDILEDLINFYKIGFELFLSEGPKILNTLKKRDKKIFLDLKFHDIPNTVYKAVKRALVYDIDMLTLHTTGGFEMMKRVKEALEEEKDRVGVSTKLLGVTVLTSIDKEMLKEIYGIEFEISSLVKKLADMAKKAGLHGVVASAQEIEIIKESCGEDFLVVTPGIRLSEIFQDDQKRTLTPKEALSKGADYLVIGRAITLSKDPQKVILNLFN